MNVDDKLYDLPFDQFSRQMQVKTLLDVLRSGTGQFTIVDVGGYKGATRALQAKDEVVVLDVFDVREKGYVKGDGNKMPFDDGRFDFATSFDVLEHIDQKSRKNFIIESNRISKRGIIAAFPQLTQANQLAEQSLNDYYQVLHGRPHQWLQEHIDYSLPDRTNIKNIFDEIGLHTITLNSNDVDSWLMMQGSIFLTSKYPESMGKQMTDLNHYYNKNIGAFDATSQESSYRQIIVGLKNINDYRKLVGWQKTGAKQRKEHDKLKLIEQINLFHAHSSAQLQEENNKLSKGFRNEQKNSQELLNAIEEIRKSKTYVLARKLSKIKNILGLGG